MPDNPDFKVLSNKRAYAGFLKIDVIEVKRGRFDSDETDTIRREVMERGDAVGIIAYDPMQDLVIVGRELRAGVLLAGEYPFVYSLPAGGINKGEDAVQAADREIGEEAGIPISNLKVAHDRLYVSAGGTSERVTLVFGTVTAPRESAVLGLPEEHENILRVSMPAKQFFKLAGTREMPDMMTTIGAYWLKAHRPALRKKYGQPSAT